MICVLENLPDELLLEIFSYLSSIDLFNSFSYLNYRFNSILCDSTIQIGTEITSTNYLKINYFKDYFHHVSICYDDIDIHQFTNVYSLTFGPSPRPTDDLLNQLNNQPRTQFPYLRKLTVYQPLSSWYSQPSIQLWNQIFTNKFSSTLEHCSLPSRIFAIPPTTFSCYSLRNLSIGGCSFRDLPILLSCLPNLKYLSTDVWGIFDIKALSSYFHINLLHLNIKFKQQVIVLEDIRCLLSCVPNLRTLTIEGTQKHDQFPIEYWHEVLLSQLERIKKFFCTIRLNDNRENRKIDINYIRTYHLLFSRMILYDQNDILYISNQ